MLRLVFSARASIPFSNETKALISRCSRFGFGIPDAIEKPPNKQSGIFLALTKRARKRWRKRAIPLICSLRSVPTRAHRATASASPFVLPATHPGDGFLRG